MNRPEMINPITKKIIYIFSEELMQLLDEGYTIEQLLNINPKDLPILPISPYIPFTGYEDIDLTTLLNLELYELKKVCKTNTYVHKLCKRKDFWLQKMKHDNLILPTPLQIKNVDWMRIYESLKDAHIFMTDIENFDDIFINMYKQYHLDDVVWILEKCDIVIPDSFIVYLNMYDKVSISSINLYQYVTNKILAYKINIYLEIENELTTAVYIEKNQMLLFLFYMFYYNLIEEIEAE